MAKTSRIILASNMKPDRDYINVLSLTDAQMLAAVTSNQTAAANNYSFIREERNAVKVNIAYSTCLTSNYMAFQNPDYSNKWFFAWIDSVEYVGENTVRIKFTVDIWTTWHNSMNWLPVFVEREHVNSDNWKEHLEPEQLSFTDLICNWTKTVYFSNFTVGVFWIPNDYSVPTTPYDINHKYATPCSVYQYPLGLSGLHDLYSDLSNNGPLANCQIVAISIIPSAFIPEDETSKLIIFNNTVNYAVDTAAAGNLDGYVPVNKKCFMYPFNYIEVDNGNISKIYPYEKFNGNIIQGNFSVEGGLLPNGAVTLYPVNYDGKSDYNVAESLSLGNFPMIAFPIDTYAAWLAQKSTTNITQGLFNTLSGAAAGFGAGGMVGAVAGAAGGVLSSVTNYHTQSEATKKSPNEIKGTNSVDIDLVLEKIGYAISQKCLRASDAERLDKFFSQFGYNVSTVKIPNYTGRSYWNYVKINGSAGYGALPESAREEINRILNQGTTLWHSHSYMGNYFIGGSKMQNPII